MSARCWLLLIAVALLTGSGCKSKPSLVGEWTGTLQIQGVPVDIDFLFGADGALAVKQAVGGQGSTQKGTYKAQEKSFSMTPTSIESAAIPKPTLDKLNADLAKRAQIVTFTLEWKGDDTIVVTQQGLSSPLNQAVTLTRKKT